MQKRKDLKPIVIRSIKGGYYKDIEGVFLRFCSKLDTLVYMSVRSSKNNGLDAVELKEIIKLYGQKYHDKSIYRTLKKLTDNGFFKVLETGGVNRYFLRYNDEN